MDEVLSVHIDSHLKRRFQDRCSSLNLDIDAVIREFIVAFMEREHIMRSRREFVRKLASNVIENFKRRMSPQPDEKVIGGMTAQEYLDLSEAERDALWDNWTKEAEQEIRAKARQRKEHRDEIPAG